MTNSGLLDCSKEKETFTETERKTTKRRTRKKKTKKILVLIDWDNLFLNLIDIFGVDKVNLYLRFDKLKEWLTGIGEIWGVFVFAPPYLSPWHRKILRQHEFFTIICDKIEPKEKTKDKKEIDTVDEKLTRFGELIISHPEISYVCLASGDDDFIPLLEEVKKKGIKIAIAPASINSLSRNLLPFADRHPKTRKKMVLRLDEV